LWADRQTRNDVREELKSNDIHIAAFWETALDHYALYSIDDLERGETYSAPQFVQRFGSFARFLPIYGGGQKLRGDLEQVKRHLYVAN
jgi:type I restriction enzyme R subunit